VEHRPQTKRRQPPSVLCSSFHLSPVHPIVLYFFIQVSSPCVLGSPSLAMSIWLPRYRDCFSIHVSSLCSVWPIRFHFLVFNWVRMGSCSFLFQSSSLLIRSGQLISLCKQSNVVNIQGVLEKGTLGYKVMLSIYRVCLEKAPWWFADHCN